MPSLRPILSVPDVDAAVEFYCRTLGFERQFSLQDKSGDSFFASVALHGCAILFSLQQPRDMPDEQRRQIRADVTLVIALPEATNIDVFYAELQATDVTILEAIEDKFWGNREFSIRDPYGYCINFAVSKRDVSLEEAKDISARLDVRPSNSAAHGV